MAINASYMRCLAWKPGPLHSGRECESNESIYAHERAQESDLVSDHG